MLVCYFIVIIYSLFHKFAKVWLYICPSFPHGTDRVIGAQVIYGETLLQLVSRRWDLNPGCWNGVVIAINSLEVIDQLFIDKLF